MALQKIAGTVFVTGNSGKLGEVEEILPGIIGKDLDLPELQGEPEEIVREKLRLAYKLLRRPVMVEDTSLSIEGFSGLPGPYIKHFLAKMGAKKLSELSLLSGEPKAVASCIFGYKDKLGTRIFKGEISGQIVSPRGSSGFGWDCIFQPDGHDETFAQMGSVKKNQISHRKLALEKMRLFFRKG
jgi:inosine triphosphate pyrophosphatase